MAQFKYIGTRTKDNGKVDVRIGKPNMAWYYEFIDVTPNVDIIEVTHEIAANSLREAVDPITKTLLYEEVV
jgi:hypothetical protein